MTRLNNQLEYLNSQFSLIGNKSSKEPSLLMKDGPADYLLYTSGRRHVQFGHWWLRLKARNDVLTLFTTQLLSLLNLAKPSNDRVVKIVSSDRIKQWVTDIFYFRVLNWLWIKTCPRNLYLPWLERIWLRI